MRRLPYNLAQSSSILFLLIFQLMHTIYTLQKAIKFILKAFNTCPHMFWSLFKTTLRGLVDCTSPGY
jgi:hypothetical protein